MSKPLCFVIMGFGKKTDFASGKTFDLDKTYKNIIKPALEQTGYECVRGDEVQDSGLIDKSMYALIIKADLVIADISTYNPNAIYELGVRHAARPFSTIIIKEKDGTIPFDLSHNRIFHYAHLGDEIGFEEVNRCVKELVSLINSVKRSRQIDSPLYEFIDDLPPLQITEEQYEKIISEYAAREKSIFAIVEFAKDEMEAGRFESATKSWAKAAELVSNEPYFVQQYALARYKSEQPSAKIALTDALRIIEKLNPDSSNDPETLGITGAIYKRLWKIDKDEEYLKRAIEYYKKGFSVTGDYYNGENYANCLEMQSEVETNPKKAIYFEIEAQNTREEVVKNLLAMDAEEIAQRIDADWIYATISNNSLGLGDTARASEYEEKFLATKPADWKIDTFNETKNKILSAQK